MPGVKRLTIERVVEAAGEAKELGIPAIAIFPVIDDALKSDGGDEALNRDNIVCRAVAAVKAALSHEKKVTGQIYALVAQADSDKDYATRSFLNWFVDGQVEEESSMAALLQVVEMAGKNLLQLESHVARIQHSG